ncbi:MAG: hypothetical protein WD904_01620 [Dehalococcoidia bacterium]
MSEAALNRVADEYLATGATGGGPDDWAGLYHVDDVYLRGDCVFVVTGGSFLVGPSGFARCDGGAPTKPQGYHSFDHFEGRWWKFTVYT